MTAAGDGGSRGKKVTSLLPAPLIDHNDNPDNKSGQCTPRHRTEHHARAFVITPAPQASILQKYDVVFLRHPLPLHYISTINPFARQSIERTVL